MFQDTVSQRSLIRGNDKILIWGFLTLLYFLSNCGVAKIVSFNLNKSDSGTSIVTAVGARGKKLDAVPFEKLTLSSFSLVRQNEYEQDFTQLLSFTNPSKPLYRLIRVPIKDYFRGTVIIPNLDIRTIIFPFHSFY